MAQFFLIAFTSVFVLVDPIAAVPAFLAMTQGHCDAKRRRHMAIRASITCFAILTLFALAGPAIFRLFGITMPAFRIAGGIILGIIGLDMLQARRSPTQETPGEMSEGAEKEDVGIVPLGVPMLAGPGAISSVMVLMAQYSDWPHRSAILGAIGLTALIALLVLAAADWVSTHLHRTGIAIFTRMMGLLLTAIAVQFVINGARDIGLIK